MAKANTKTKGSDGVIAGVLVLALGVLFLFNNTFGFDITWHKYWPILLILVGLYMILGKIQSKS